MTITSSPKPRTRPAPSPRDQQIYIDYQTTGRAQTELAADYKLTQCRISQILRRVARWLSVGWALPTVCPVGWDQAAPAAAGPPSPSFNPEPQAKVPYRAPVGRGSPDPAALERRLEHERLNLVCREAMHHFRHEQKTITHKKGTRGDNSFDETTERTHPPSLQALKVILQATRQLEKVLSKRAGWDKLEGTAAERWSSSAGPRSGPPPLDDAEFRQQVINWLAAGRDRVEKAGLVSPDPDNRTVARELVKSFFGEAKNDFAVYVLARDIGKELVTARPGTPPHKWSCRRSQSTDPSKAATSGRGLPSGQDDIDATEFDTCKDHEGCSSEAESAISEDEPRDPVDPVGCMSDAKSNITTDQSCDDKPAPTAFSITCASPPDSPQPQPPPNVPTQNQISNIKNKPHQYRHKPESSHGVEDPLRRRLAHQDKLRQLREAQERGLPSMIYLDPQEEPIPRIEYQLDDPGWQPTIQSKEHQAELVRDYMQKLHEQNNLKP